jgi:hypothetical protein
MKMKSRILIYPFFIMGLVLMLTNSCKKKEEVPVLTTSAVTDITKITATSGGLITSDGGAAITARGVCWSTGETPTIADSKTNSNKESVSFTSEITGLSAGTTYYVRAYAINSAGIGYGTAVSFTTLPVDVPVLTTSAASEIADITATCGGNVTSDGGSAVTARGVCWSTAADPTTADSKTTDGTGTGEFTSAITGLTAGTIYNVRAYATNSAGTGYGTAVSFSTLAPAGAPELTTSAVSDVTSTTATSGGNITSEGSSAVTARGVCWGTGDSPTIADSKTTDGDGTGEFTSSITDLTSGTTYYVRAYATNSVGTSYGTAVSFTTEIAIIGNNAEGTNQEGCGQSLNAIRYQCTQNMTVTKMFVNIAVSGTGPMKCAFYTDNAGVPETFLMGTNEVTNAPTGWQQFDLTSGLELTVGTYYYLVQWASPTAYEIYYTIIPGGNGTPFRWDLDYGEWPSPLGEVVPYPEATYCIYAQ